MFFGAYKKFEEEALQYMDSMYYLALKFTRDESKANDLLQESYLKAFKNYKSFKEGTNLKAWLSRILTNTFINDYRKKKKEKFVFSIDDKEEMYYSWYDDNVKNLNANPEKKYFFKELGKDINKALDGLPDDSKMIIIYADLYEFSYKDISEILDIPIGTVMSRLHRARKLLHSELYEYAKNLGILDKKKEQKIIKFMV